MVVTLDPPRHGPLRRVAMRRLHPSRDQGAQRRHRALALEVLDGIDDAAAGGEEFDFVQHVAAPLPIAVIAWFLGVPKEDRELLFHWTNEVIGKDDPEFRRPGETPDQTLKRARIEMHAYLAELVERHRREPGEDIVSELIAAEIDGRAAHRAATALVLRAHRRGGQRDHPQRDQRRAARARPQSRPVGAPPAPTRRCFPTRSRRCSATSRRSSTSPAPRWKTPRCTASRIHEGDKLALFFASANRDDDVFDDPFAFRIDRDPQPAPRVRHRPALLHGRAPRPPRDADGVPPPARPPRLVRGHRPGGTTQLGGERGDQAPPRALPAWPDGDLTEPRSLGATGVQVSAIGFGCQEVGGGYGDIDEAEFARAVGHALDIGINLFDTAEAYGFGASEEALGRALHGSNQRT